MSLFSFLVFNFENVSFLKNYIELFFWIYFGIFLDGISVRVSSTISGIDPKKVEAL